MSLIIFAFTMEETIDPLWLSTANGMALKEALNFDEPLPFPCWYRS
jgi:hypothetical protein